MTEPERWSGYETQSRPWRRGYDWAYDRGDHHELGIVEAIEAWGYDLDSENADEFERGATFAQNEQQVDLDS